MFEELEDPKILLLHVGSCSCINVLQVITHALGERSNILAFITLLKVSKQRVSLTRIVVSLTQSYFSNECESKEHKLGIGHL